MIYQELFDKDWIPPYRATGGIYAPSQHLGVDVHAPLTKKTFNDRIEGFDVVRDGFFHRKNISGVF